MAMAVACDCMAANVDGKPQTVDVIWKILLWSFLALEAGVWPKVDPDDKPFTSSNCGANEYRKKKKGLYLAGGYFAFIAKAKADLVAFQNSFNIPYKYTSLDPCWVCKVVGGYTATQRQKALHFTNFTKTAQCWQERRTRSEWDEFLRRVGYPHPLFTLISIFACVPDLMHMGDLGFTSVACGAVLFTLFEYEPLYSRFLKGHPS